MQTQPLRKPELSISPADPTLPPDALDSTEAVSELLPFSTTELYVAAGTSFKKMATVLVSTATLVTMSCAVAAASESTDGRAHTGLSITAATPSTGTVEVNGSYMTLTGRSTANLRGSQISVQVHRGSTWAPTSARTRVSSRATYSVRVLVAVGRPGVYSYRVVYGGSRKLSTATASRSVRVWGWFSLAGQDVVNAHASCCGDLGDGGYGVDQVSLAGRNYANSVYLTPGGDNQTWEEYNLGYHCIQFKALVGVDDNQASGSTAGIVVSGDGANRVSQDLTLGRAYGIRADVSGVFRLQIEANGSDGTQTDWPGAQILCNTNPNPND